MSGSSVNGSTRVFQTCSEGPTPFSRIMLVVLSIIMCILGMILLCILIYSVYSSYYGPWIKNHVNQFYLVDKPEFIGFGIKNGEFIEMTDAISPDKTDLVITLRGLDRGGFNTMVAVGQHNVYGLSKFIDHKCQYKIEIIGSVNMLPDGIFRIMFQDKMITKEVRESVRQALEV